MAYQYERTIKAIEEDRKKKKEEDAKSGWQKFTEGTGKVIGGIGSFTGDVLQSIPRGVVNIGLTLDEAGRNQSLDSRNQNIDRILTIDKEKRKKLLEAYNSPEQSKNMSDQDWSDAFLLNQAEKTLGGTDDNTLKKRRDENAAERKTHKTYKAGNDFTKFLVGGEEDEVAQSGQKTNEDITKWGEEQGLDKGQASSLGMVGAVGLTALDAPTGIGSLVKSPLKALGKKGLKELVETGTEEGAKAIIRKAIPKVTDDVLNELAPQLARATDAKTVKEIIRNSKPLTETLGATVASSKDTLLQKTKDAITGNVSVGSAKEAAQLEAKGLVLDTADDVVEAGTKKAGNSLQPATDELLGHLKTTSDLQKMGKKPLKDRLKEQWVDKLLPVYEMIKTIEERTGKKLAAEDDPYELMRLYNGMPDAVQQRITTLRDIFKESPDLGAVTAIGLSRQIRGRAERGITSFVTPEKAKQVIQEQYDKLGQEGFDKASKVVEAINEYNRGLLDDLHEAGIISDDALKAIKDTGADYFSRFNVVDYIMKNDANRELFARGGSYNETQQALNKILKGAKGMEEGTEILSPIDSIARSTDLTMRNIAKNQMWQAFDRLADIAPDLITRVKNPDDIIERIALSLDNKQLRPIRNKLDRMISTRGQWVRKLESQINQLEKKGLNTSLKNGGQRMTAKDFVVDGLGGKVPTSQVGKIGGTAKRVGDKTVQGYMDVINPQKLGPSDTGKFLRNLIENGSRSDIDKLKKMVGNRDAKLTKLLDDIGEMKSEYDDIAGTIKGNSSKIKELADAQVPDGMELISGFGKGVQGKLAVPKEVAEVYTGKTKAQQDYMTSTMGRLHSFIKKNFTGNNIAFAFWTNPNRDAKTWAMNSKNVSAAPHKLVQMWSEGLWGRIIRDQDYADWIASGGKSGFYASERTADQMSKELTRAVYGKGVLKTLPIRNVKDFATEVSRVIAMPVTTIFKGIQGGGSILEDAPRLAEFKAARKAGKSLQSAAFDARNVTADFQQAGKHAQIINAWIPFFNPRLQGTIKSAEAIKKNPARAASVYAMLTAAPIIATEINNNQYPEVLKNISEDDRTNNFILILGDERNDEGRYTQVIKIPKSDVDKILGNPLEQAVRYLYDDDPQSVQEVLTNLVGNTLPFDTVRDGKFSLERTTGSLTPPVIKTPIEAVTNRNLYFGTDIVPERMQDLPNAEQVKPNTSMAARFLSSVTGASPLKTDNTIRNLTGTIITKNPLEQITGKAVGASGNKMNDEFYSTLDKTKKNRASASKYINEALAAGDVAAAKQAARSYNQYFSSQFSEFASRYGSQMTKELADTYDEQKIILTNRSIKQRQRNALERQAAGQ